MSGIYIAMGRIGRDAERRSTPNGTSVANWPMAVDVGYGDKKTTLWLDCALWGKRAEGGLVQYLTKGQQVMVRGELGTREFQRGDGTPGFAVTLNVQDVDLAGGSPQGNQKPQQQGGGQQQGGYHNQQYQQNQQQPQQQNQQQQQGGGFGAPEPGQYDDFDSEIPF